MLKKFISTLVLICVMVCCFSFNVFAETTVDDEIALTNLYTNKISTNITRSSSKKISYDCSVTGKSTATKITVYLYLQENVNGSWRNVHVLRKEVNGKYLTATDSYSSAISGHKYRTELQVYTYSGSKSEYLELHSTVLNFWWNSSEHEDILS